MSRKFINSFGNLSSRSVGILISIKNNPTLECLIKSEHHNET